jgi:hypothetical protein
LHWDEEEVEFDGDSNKYKLVVGWLEKMETTASSRLI